MTDKISFSTLDYIIFTGLLSISAGFGIFYGCFGTRQSTSEEIHLGTRQMNASGYQFPRKLDCYLFISKQFPLAVLGTARVDKPRFQLRLKFNDPRLASRGLYRQHYLHLDFARVLGLWPCYCQYFLALFP